MSNFVYSLLAAFHVLVRVTVNVQPMLHAFNSLSIIVLEISVVLLAVTRLHPGRMVRFAFMALTLQLPSPPPRVHCRRILERPLQAVGTRVSGQHWYRALRARIRLTVLGVNFEVVRPLIIALPTLVR